jgi:ferulate-5-hydroxylase
MAVMMHNPNDLRCLQKELTDVVGFDRNVNESNLDKLPFLKCVVKEMPRLHLPILLLHETVEDADTFRLVRFAPEGEVMGLDSRAATSSSCPSGPAAAPAPT